MGLVSLNDWVPVVIYQPRIIYFRRAFPASGHLI
jgi:hypothetical protein